MKVTAVVTAHNMSPHAILGDLHYQSRPPDEVLLYISSVPPAEIRKIERDFSWVKVSVEPDLDDWGHAKREKGLEEATGDVIGWFNADDSYELDYISKLLAPIEKFGFDAAFCNWSPNYEKGVRFAAGSSTSGNFLVRVDKARKAGYPERNASTGKHNYDSDGRFINSIPGEKHHVDEVLYHHNSREAK